MKELTIEEQNILKDILKMIGRDDDLNTQFAKVIGMNEKEFDSICESIFKKLQNGRLVVETE